MELNSKKVSKRLKEYKEIKKLMKRVFPKNELFPMWYLLLLSKMKMVQFYSYYEDNKFVGISYSLINDNMVFILYLAVNDKIQSKGYGTKILNIIKENNKGKEITLNIEPLDKNADNYQQRLRRYEFYKRNNFNNTGYYIDDTDKYLVLSTKEELNIKEYKKIFKDFSFGYYSVKLQKK